MCQRTAPRASHGTRRLSPAIRASIYSQMPAEWPPLLLPHRSLLYHLRRCFCLFLKSRLSSSLIEGPKSSRTMSPLRSNTSLLLSQPARLRNEKSPTRMSMASPKSTLSTPRSPVSPSTTKPGCLSPRSSRDATKIKNGLQMIREMSWSKQIELCELIKNRIQLLSKNSDYTVISSKELCLVEEKYLYDSIFVLIVTNNQNIKLLGLELLGFFYLHKTIDCDYEGEKTIQYVCNPSEELIAHSWCPWAHLGPSNWENLLIRFSIIAISTTTITFSMACCCLSTPSEIRSTRSALRSCYLC